MEARRQPLALRGTPAAAAADAAPPEALRARFRASRARTAALLAPLGEADAQAQSMPDASPAKWHGAHTSWFYEAFLFPALRLAPRRPQWDALFNSYYVGLGRAIHPRAQRGLLTRPTLAEICLWRAEVEAAIESAWPRFDAAALATLALGIAHEEQHQELLLADLLHLLAHNPLAPAYAPPPPAAVAPADAPGWVPHAGGVAAIGAAEAEDSFAFDCERPRHRVLLAPFALARRAVSNADWQAFIEDGGYRQPRLWLADGWAWVAREAIAAPLHWRADGMVFTLAGLRPRDPAAPVAHISHYEADAFASWAGARLPTEAEWEAAAALADPGAGDQLDDAVGGAARCAPLPGPAQAEPFGGVWQWTASAFLPHPGFRPGAGALGEYNGKFMSGQMVLKGASCATPRGHSRPAYRNFFPPAARWQWSGLRLARNG